MTTNFRALSVAVAILVGASTFVPMQAQAKSTFMADCSALYKAGKADGSVADTVKWTDFMKNSCAALKTPADTAAVPAVTPVKAKKGAAAPVATIATTASGSFMQNCSAEWKAMKAAGTVPAGMAWKDFVAAKCVVDASATPAPAVKPAKKKATQVVATQDPTPADPAVVADTGDVKTVDKNGKPFTPGQLAAHARARACGQEWRAAKAAGQIQLGQKWPQFWSECNTRMKTAGQ
jgi:hypothetical protein